MEKEDALSHRCQRMELDLRIYYWQGTLCPVEKAGELCKGDGSTHGSRDCHLGVSGEAMALLLSVIMGQRSSLNPSTWYQFWGLLTWLLATEL